MILPRGEYDFVSGKYEAIIMVSINDSYGAISNIT